MELTLAHGMYAFVTLVVIVTMVMRRGVVLPTLIGTFIVAWMMTGNLVTGFTSVFNANLTAATELFNIFLIITFMVALLYALKDLGADQEMIKPIQKIMVNGHLAFFVLVVVTYVISLFFWPTPAVPLICALLLPAAVSAGLPVIGGAMAIAIAGQGMALSSDYVIQIAPTISATAGNLETAIIADKALVLSLIAGVIAIGIAYLMIYKKIKQPENPLNEKEMKKLPGQSEEEITTRKLQTKNLPVWRKFFAYAVPMSMLLVMLFMVYTKVNSGGASELDGGDGAAFIGGVAVLLLAAASVAYGKGKAFDHISEHITNGFVFAFKAMGPVIPIAGFFFLGSNEFSGSILSLGEDATAPALLFELVEAGQNAIPESAFLTAFGILIIGIITGLDGSGFSGLPLTGALSGALNTNGIDPETLAAIGQLGSIWTGGGTIVAWSSLVAIAGFSGISVMELVRKNFLPVMVGLIVMTIVAVLIW